MLQLVPLKAELKDFLNKIFFKKYKLLHCFSNFSPQNLKGGSRGKKSKQIKSGTKFQSCSETRKWLMKTPGVMFKLETPGDILRIIFSCL